MISDSIAYYFFPHENERVAYEQLVNIFERECTN